MFIEFYYVLRDMKIPVSITEFLSLMEAISQKLVQDTYEFYYVARSLLIKDEKYYDHFDQAFAFYFKDASVPEKLKEELFDWLKKPAPSIFDHLQLSQEERDLLQKYSWEDLRKMFEERMNEQNEEHNGGELLDWYRWTFSFRMGWFSSGWLENRRARGLWYGQPDCSSAIVSELSE